MKNYVLLTKEEFDEIMKYKYFFENVRKEVFQMNKFLKENMIQMLVSEQQEPKRQEIIEEILDEDDPFLGSIK